MKEVSSKEKEKKIKERTLERVMIGWLGEPDYVVCVF